MPPPRITLIMIVGTVAALVGTLRLTWYSDTDSTRRSHVIYGAWDSGEAGKLAIVGSLVMLMGVAWIVILRRSRPPIQLSVVMLVTAVCTAAVTVVKFTRIHNDAGFGLLLTVLGALLVAYAAARQIDGRVPLRNRWTR